MATRYCVHGATNNGDGTTSAEASTPGGTGAYNDFTECLKNSANYTVSAGDVCYVKSSPAGAGGGDLTITETTLTTIAAGSNITSLRNFIIDDGTTWAQSGTLIFECSTSVWTLGSWTSITAPKNKLVLRSTNSGAGTGLHIVAARSGCVLDGANIVVGYNVSDTSGSRQTAIQVTDDSIFIPYLKLTWDCRFTTNYSPFYLNSGTMNIGHLEIEITASTSTAREVFDMIATFRPSSVTIDSLRWYDTGGTYTTDQDRLLRAEMGHFKCLQSETPYLDNIYIDTYGISYPSTVTIQRADDLLYDWIWFQWGVECRWDSGDGNYPTGAAILPDDSSTPWSIYFRPTDLAFNAPALVMHTHKIWNATAAQVVVTVEFLVRNTFTNVTQNRYWIDVTYINDSGGALVHETSRAVVATTACTAGSGLGLWSALTYGAQTMSSYKLTLTTVNSVKEDTTMTIKMYTNNPAPDSTSIGFIDPDPDLTAV